MSYRNVYFPIDGSYCIRISVLIVRAHLCQIASDGPEHSSHGPYQGADCLSSSDCRTGYNCEKGNLDRNSRAYSTQPGICLRIRRIAVTTPIV